MVKLYQQYDASSGKNVYVAELGSKKYISASKQKVLSMIAKEGLITAGRGALNYSSLILNDTAKRHANADRKNRIKSKDSDRFLKHVTGL